MRDGKWEMGKAEMRATCGASHRPSSTICSRLAHAALVFVFLVAFIPATAAGTEYHDLSGRWAFKLDRSDEGVEARWFERDLGGKVELPGALPAQGIGDDVSLETKWTGGIQDPKWFTKPIYAPYTNSRSFKFPFWLQPEKYYAGAAWYQRDIEIPPDWAGRRIVLHLERPHWQTTVWLDNKLLGSDRSLFTPHIYELGAGLRPGKHRLTIRVDNRMVVDVGENSHCVSDHTQGNWNGIVGDIRLDATPLVWIADLQAYPKLPTRTVLVRGAIRTLTGKPGTGKLRLRAEEAVERGNFVPRPEAIEMDVRWDVDGGSFEREIPAPFPAWDEFNPALCNVSAELSEHGSQKTVLFGMREITADGNQLLINGRKLFIRGTLECSIFPLTGHPPTTLDGWRKVYHAARQHGLNSLRFHSHCPPEAAFYAADELGFYLQVETCWANQSTTIGDGKPVDQWVYEETERILRAYGNHPSFVLMAHGNEPGGRNANAYLAKYVSHFKARDSRRLWTSGAGWPQLPENQFHVTPDPRIQGWGQGLNSRINAKPPETRTDYREYIEQRKVPVISHEIGQWCVYPNFDEIKKYKGYLKPKNFEIFRASLNAHHMGDQARDFLYASGKLQTLCYKEDIESALRTPRMGGFQLLDLHDFPGQGTALVGVLDPFWESKGYVAPAEFRRFCNSTVPLARLSKRVFTSEETLEADLEVAHFGPAALKETAVEWKLVDSKGNARVSGRFEIPEIPVGNGVSVGKVSAKLAALPAPAQGKLVVRLANSRFEGLPARDKAPEFENDWDIWIYPARLETPDESSIYITAELDDAAAERLDKGGKVLLTIPPGRVKGDELGRVALGFSSIFWNTAWTDRQPPHTLGILCNPKHPLFASFPTESHSNWQWWYLIHRAGAMILDELPPKLRPIVQVIDDWVTNRRLGLAFEARVGKGKLMVTSIDLAVNDESDPVIRQFRHSLLSYLASEAFAPKEKVTLRQVRQLVKPASAIQKYGAKVVQASSAQTGYEPENVLDGDPKTIWHTSWETPPAGFPHAITIALARPVRLQSITVLPRQDGNPNGWIKDYEVFLSQDWRQWGLAAASGSWPANAQAKNVELNSPVPAQFIRLVAKSGHAKGPWASLAELEIHEAGNP